ncbi:MAG: WD40 repeat domain-containing protein [Mycobacteriales bacterium]
MPPTSKPPTSKPTSTANTATSPPVDYAKTLAAIAADGDIVLVDPDTAAVVRTVIRRDARFPATSVAWDAPRRMLYFGRGGDCASVWRHELGAEPVYRLSSGHHPVVSPDGTQLAVADGCDGGGGQANGITVRDSSTGAVLMQLPIMIPSAARPEEPWYVGDIDWRPDGGALVVTVGWEGIDEQRLVDVRRPPRSVIDGKRVVIKPSPPDVTHAEIEFFADTMAVAGRCCFGASGERSGRLFARDERSGELTPIATGDAFSLTADATGRLRYLASSSFSRPAALWGIDRPGAEPREIGGLFSAVSG